MSTDNSASDLPCSFSGRRHLGKKCNNSIFPQDLEAVGTLIGLKTFVNEFAAYDRMKQMKDILTPRSKAIATYALCGFSNPASIGIQIAGLGTMAPNRRGDLAKVAFRAFCAGSMACFLTACVAGALIEV